MKFADSTVSIRQHERSGERPTLTCGNFFNPSSSSFLGGSIGQTVAEVGLGLMGVPTWALALGGAGVGLAQGGGLKGAALGALGGYGAGELAAGIPGWLDTGPVATNTALTGNAGQFVGGGTAGPLAANGGIDLSGGLLTQEEQAAGLANLNQGAGVANAVPGTTLQVQGQPFDIGAPISSGAAAAAPALSNTPSLPQQQQQGDPTTLQPAPLPVATPPAATPGAEIPAPAQNLIAGQLAGGNTAMPWGGGPAVAPDYVAQGLEGVGAPGGMSAAGYSNPSIVPSGVDPSIWQRIQGMMPSKATMGTINTVGNLGSTAYGLYQSNQIGNMAKGMDAMAPYRAGYAGQLAALNANPGSITSMPGYQFGMDQGTQAVQRAGAAQGYTGSGNMAIALQNYGQNYANQYLQQQQQYLASLASGSNPAAIQSTALAAQLAGQSIGSLGYGLNRQYGTA